MCSNRYDGHARISLVPHKRMAALQPYLELNAQDGRCLVDTQLLASGVSHVATCATSVLLGRQNLGTRESAKVHVSFIAVQLRGTEKRTLTSTLQVYLLP